MEDKLKSMIFGLILILFGVSLIPIVFTAVGNANWTIATGVYNANASLSTYVAHDVSWIGYIVGLLFALALVGVGVAVLIHAFKKH